MYLHNQERPPISLLHAMRLPCSTGELENECRVESGMKRNLRLWKSRTATVQQRESLLKTKCESIHFWGNCRGRESRESRRNRERIEGIEDDRGNRRNRGTGSLKDGWIKRWSMVKRVLCFITLADNSKRGWFGGTTPVTLNPKKGRAICERATISEAPVEQPKLKIKPRI